METINEVLKAAQSYVNKEPFNVLSNSATICTEDLHCHNLGICVENTCVCEGSYTGQFCEWTNTTYDYMQDIFESSLLVLEGEVDVPEMSVSKLRELSDTLANMW